MKRDSEGPAVSGDAAEAADARVRAEQALQQALCQADETRDVAERMRAHRRVNHFAELIGATFRGTS